MSRSDRKHMLNGLKFSDRPTELHPLIGIGQRIVHAAFHAPRCIVWTRMAAQKGVDPSLPR